MGKLTKIVATIGPASDTEEKIEELINAGVNVIRFNFKHSEVSWHNERIIRVQKVAARMKQHVGILLDLQGPEIRINLPVDEIHVQEDELLVLGERVFQDKNVKGIFVSHPQMLPYLEIGQKLIADDGKFTFYVAEKKKDEVILQVKNTGILKNRKSLRIPGSDFPFPLLIDRDFDGLKLAARTDIDYVALSYVRTADDIKTLRKEMAKHKVDAQIISKIETRSSINHLDEIIKESDGIMVARGDLGIELPIEEVPYYQKIIINKSLERGIPVITATQMLESMTANPFPTRAEVSDVANATYDLTDAVMLSGESASGKHPIKTVEMMKKTIVANETKFVSDTRKRFNFQAGTHRSLLCETAYNLSLALDAQKEKMAGFIVFSCTGQTVKLLSRYRPSHPIYALVDTEKVAHGLSVNYGVTPVLIKHVSGVDDKFVTVEKKSVQKIIKHILANHHAIKGTYIMVHGDDWFNQGQTSTVKLIRPEGLDL